MSGINRIRSYRKEKGLSIYDLAEKTKITPGYIANLERGTRRNPSKEVMEKIASALEKTVQEVFFPEEKKEGRKCVTG